MYTKPKLVSIRDPGEGGIALPVLIKGGKRKRRCLFLTTSYSLFHGVSRSNWTKFNADIRAPINFRRVFCKLCYYFLSQHRCWTETSILVTIFLLFTSFHCPHLFYCPPLCLIAAPASLVSMQKGTLSTHICMESTTKQLEWKTSLATCTWWKEAHEIGSLHPWPPLQVAPPTRRTLLLRRIISCRKKQLAWNSAANVVHLTPVHLVWFDGDVLYESRSTAAQ